jgi:hypothetical protein
VRVLYVAVVLIVFAGTATAQMMRNDAIGNDPAKERLCASRAKSQTVPFEIDSRYVTSERSSHPDATFIAIDGMSPQLVECYLREGTGRYEPASSSPEQSYWRLIKPKQFETGINTTKGISMASNVCLDAARAKINRPNYDHIVYTAVVEVNLGGPKYHPGAQIAGKIAQRYDIAVEGTYFYRSPPGPDLAAIRYHCPEYCSAAVWKTAATATDVASNQFTTPKSN